MHYVIRGGAGFISSHLADELVKGNEVAIRDNLSTGRVVGIKHLIGRNNVIFAKGSITDRKVLREVIPGADGIFHQAAIPSTEVDVSPIHGPPRPEDIRHSFADISTARKAFGYELKYDLWKGLEETLS